MTQQSLIKFLVEKAKHINDSMDDSLSGIYLHGSLVNDEGRGFSMKKSDVDILFTTALESASERVEFVDQLRSQTKSLEKSLRSFIKTRDVYPISSFCVATEFELKEGVHKNRNTRNAFAIEGFRLLTSSDENLRQVGDPLRDDLVGTFFPAWTVLAEAQSFRSRYVTWKADLKPTVSAFEEKYLALPKELLRNSYLLFCLIEGRDPAMVYEDDIAKGLNFLRDLIENAAKTDKDAKEIDKLISTNRPGGKGDPRPVQPKQLLYLWEMLASKTEETLAEQRVNSGTPRLRLAADVVIRELSRLGAGYLGAVDMAVELFCEQDLLQGPSLAAHILPHLELELYEFSDFHKTDLRRLIEEWPQDIRDYLTTRLGVAGSSDSQCKVGFAGLEYTQRGIDRAPRLIIRPLTYWVTQQFNKEMAVNRGHKGLSHMRESYARKLFKSAEDFRCECPSHLYLEVAVVTADGFVPILSKGTQHSVFGKRRGEAVNTCGVEHGFVWKEHVDISNPEEPVLNVAKALYDGLRAELTVQPTEVVTWTVSALAIQHSHLNAALLGVVSLNLTRRDLVDRLKLPTKYFDSMGFLPRREALLTAEQDKGTGRWHQTALMRLTLIQ